MKARSIGHYWAKCLVQQWVASGLTHVCIAPGSRSTCLVLAVHECKELTITTHYDERSAGFFALGYAKEKKVPMVIITTSGSAVANLMPSVVEANELQIPMLLVTADRPQELHHCGANQTMNQLSMFKDYTVKQFNIDTPTDNLHSFSTFKQFLNGLHVYYAQGPVHVNIAFREPFVEATENTYPPFKPTTMDKKMQQHNDGEIVEKELKEWFDQYVHNKRVLCILGNTATNINQQLLINWAKKACIPLLSECSSTLTWTSSVGRQMDMSVKLLKQEKLLPETIICIGSKWISTAVHNLLKQTKHILMAHDFKGSQNWLNVKSLEMSLKDINCIQQISHVQANAPYEDMVRQLVIKREKIELMKCNHSSEQQYILALSEIVQQYKRLFVGNSMSVRLVNNFLLAQSNKLKSYTQRGLSGIDGLISTATGISYAARVPLVAILGDLSFFYDINGLHSLTYCSTPLLIVVINNQGGRIFESLPIGNDPVCESLFVQPHKYSVKDIAKSFNINYLHINHVNQMDSLLVSKVSVHTILELSVKC